MYQKLLEHEGFEFGEPWNGINLSAVKNQKDGMEFYY